MSTRMTAPAIALLMTLTVGCATTNGSTQGPGAVVLGGLTTLGCLLLGGSASACAAAGTAVGLVAWKSMTPPERGPENRVPIPAEEPPPKRATIVIKRFDVAPKEVLPGGTFSATTQYVLRIPSKTEMLPVTQTFTLVKDNEVIKEIPAMVEELKDHGRYEVAWDFTIPDNADLGAYELRQVLEAQTRSPETRQATFKVVQRVAALTLPGR